MPLEDWGRLASYVIARRVKLGYRDRKALAAVSGVTARTLGKLETGRPVGAVTLADVELALGWEPDSARRVLAGAEPVIREPREVATELPELDDEERRVVIAVIQGMRATRNGERRGA
jgi:hypothetical protein